MHAITIRQPGGPEALEWLERDDPAPGPDEVLIDITSSAVNRADLLQRQGFYPPPTGVTDVPGLECAGTIAALGEGVEGWQVGEQVCALLAGGGYAERVTVPAAQVLPVPEGVDLESAGGLPEVVCTVWSTVVMHAGLRKGEVLLVHGGSGGIGTFAIQLGRAFGATVATTAGSAERLERCAALGADIPINYREQDFVAEIRSATGGGGANVVLDNMGAKYLDRNLDVLAPDGRLVIIGMQGGTKAEINLGALLPKRLSVAGIGLRGRPVDGRAGKANIVADVRWQVWPRFERGEITPVVHTRIPMRDAAQAHRLLDEGTAFGKVLLVNE